MAEKSVSQMLKETLFYDPKPATVRLSDEELAAADRYCEGIGLSWTVPRRSGRRCGPP